MSGFDVEVYIGNYQGFTRVKRMGFISGQNSALKADVLRTAIDEVKKTTNTVLYIELITMVGDTPGLGARDGEHPGSAAPTPLPSLYDGATLANEFARRWEHVRPRCRPPRVPNTALGRPRLTRFGLA